MITNSILVWLVLLLIFVSSLLMVVKIAVRHQQLQHHAESLAIEAARSKVMNFDISDRDICNSLRPDLSATISTCALDQKWVKIELSEPVSMFGRTLNLRVQARVGFGFYSQNSP